MTARRTAEALAQVQINYQRAEANFEQARQAVDEYYTLVSETTLLDRPDLADLRKELLETALAYYQDFAAQAGDDPAIRAELVAAYFRVAQITHQLSSSDWLASFQKGLKIAERLAGENTDVGQFESWRAGIIKIRYNMGLQGADPVEAFRSFKKAVEIWEQLVQENPDVAGLQQDLGSLYLMVGAAHGGSTGSVDQVRFYQRAREIREKLVRDHPTDPEYRFQLADIQLNTGIALQYLGRNREAEEAYQQALGLFEKLATAGAFQHLTQDKIGAIHRRLAGLFSDTGRVEAAEEALRQAIAIREKLVADFPYPGYRGGLARCYTSLGVLLAKVGRTEEAEEVHRRAKDLYETVVPHFPSEPVWRQEQGYTHWALGNLMEADGRLDEAEQSYRQMLASYEKLAVDFPGMHHYRHMLGSSHMHLGQLLEASGRDQAAEQAFRQMMSCYEKLVADFPEVHHYRHMLGSSYMQLGQLLAAGGRDQEAEQTYRQMMGIYEKLVADDLPTVNEQDARLYRARLSESHINLAKILRRQSRPAEAAEHWRQALEVNPDDAGTLNSLAWSLATCADPQFRDAGRAVELAKKAVELTPEKGAYWNTLGVAYYAAGDWQAAIETLAKSMTLKSAGNSYDFFFLAMAHWQLGEKEEAGQWFEKGAAWMEKNKAGDVELGRIRAEAAGLLGIEEE